MRSSLCWQIFFRMEPALFDKLFEEPGDHADEFETSVMLHLFPELVQMEHARAGEAIPFEIDEIKQKGVWTPRPWSVVHPDTGCGDPKLATAEKGEAYCNAVVGALGKIIVSLCRAKKGDIPYL